jgi:hypothetical protein
MRIASLVTVGLVLAWGACGGRAAEGPDAAADGAAVDGGERDASSADAAADTITATDSAGTDVARCTTDGGVPLCDPALGPVTPVGLDDAAYSAWTILPCFEDACLCHAGCPRAGTQAFLQALLACDAVQGGYWWGLGSRYVRVVGRAGGSCVFDLGDEVEGYVSILRCAVPLPLAPWTGLSNPGGESFTQGIEASCVARGGCSLQPGPPDQCSSSTLAPPLCPPAAQLLCGAPT